MQERVHQRATGRAGRRVNDHTHGFVDHDQVVIFMPDIKRDILGARLKVFGDFDRDFDLIAFGQSRAGVCDDCAVYLHGRIRHQARKARAAEVGFLWHIARDRLIKTGRGIFPDNKGNACVCQRRFP